MQPSSQVGSVLAPNGADESRYRELRKLNADLGPVVLEALTDPLTVEVMLNADGRLWQERLGEPMREIGTMPVPQAEAVLRCVAATLKTVVTREHPLLEGELPDGSRFAGQLPPVVPAATFAIRKRASAVYTLGQYVDNGIMTLAQADALRQAVKDRRNLLISGGTGTGKSTLANAILADITRQYPDERLVVLEDTVELQVSSRNAVQYRTSENVDLRRLLRMTLRMRPDRVIVGEVRGAEALDLLIAWNLGHPGGLSTIHSNSAREALLRLEMLVGMHPGAPRDIERFIVETRPVVVHLERAPGGRVVREVLEVTGSGSDGYSFSQL
jgi:type IV secretion system protein TrbB